MMVDPKEQRVAAQALRDYVAANVPSMMQHFIKDSMYDEVAMAMLQAIDDYRTGVVI